MANYYKSTLASGGGAIGDADVADVLAGKTFSSSNGSGLTGTMVNRGSVGTQTLTPSTTSYTIPQGYHNGNGKVQISIQEKSVTATTSAQDVTPDSGKVLSKVTVNPQNHTATYTPTSRASALDMGANNNNRYVNTNSVPNSNSGTYTFASGDTGGTKDMGETNSYRYVNAANVYAAGVNASNYIERSTHSITSNGTAQTFSCGIGDLLAFGGVVVSVTPNAVGATLVSYKRNSNYACYIWKATSTSVSITWENGGIGSLIILKKS